MDPKQVIEWVQTAEILGQIGADAYKRLRELLAGAGVDESQLAALDADYVARLARRE